MKNKAKKGKQNIFFTAEVFGMALALFCVLGLLCLVTTDLLFGDLGLIVSRFFLGVFGYLSYPVLILLTFVGVKWLIGFKIENQKVKKAIGFACFYLIFIGLILQSALTQLSIESFGAYLNSCYQSGLSYSTSTVGGALLGLICYPLATLISPAGAYVVYSLALAFGTLYLSRHKLGEFLSEKVKGKKDDEELKDENESKKEKKKNLLALNIFKRSNKEESETQPEVAVAQFDSFETDPKPKKNVIFGGGKFELKDSKDKNNSSPNLRILFGENDGMKAFAPKKEVKNETLFVSPVENERSYRDSYDRDLDRKTQFVRTPYTTNERPMVNSPMGDIAREEKANFYTTSQEESLNIDVSQPENDIYVVRQAPKERAPISSFDRMVRGEENRDSIADRVGETREEYNRDRFSSSNEDYNRDRFSSLNEQSGRGEVNTSNEEYNRDRFSSLNEDYTRRENQPISAERGRGDLNEERVFDRGLNNENINTSRTFEDFNTESNFDSINRERTLERQKTSPNLNVGERVFDRGGLNNAVEENNEDKKENNLYEDFNSTEEQPSYDEAFGGGTFFIDAGKKRAKHPIFQDQSHRTYEQPAREPARSTFERSETTRSPINDSSMAAEQNKAVTGKQISISDIPEENQLINPIDNIPKNYKYAFPPVSLLEDYLPDEKQIAKNKEEQSKRSAVILNTLAQTNIEAKIEDIRFGPTITRFELSIPITVQVKRVNERYDDLNLWLASREKIRLITPIQGTTRIGIEVPNSSSGTVGLKSIIESKEFKNAKKGGMVFALGKDVIGTPVTLDIATMPHLLVAGATGTGKSVFLNTLLLSLIYKYSPEELRIILVDPKKVELSKFRGMPNLMFNEIFTDNANVCSMLEWAVQEMEERYKILEESGQKNVNEYNEYVGPRGKKMFKILIIIDEFADLMNSSNERKLMENKISRLAAKSRAAGIHLIMATQRPSADIMEGSIKTNFVSRIAFKSASGTDSQVILGEVGAEKLLGRGDMLFKMGNMPTPERAQGCFVDTPEIDAVCKYVKENNQCYYDEFALEKILKGAKEEEPAPVQSSGSGGGGGHIGGRIDEDLVKEIMRFAITINNISISGMQRKFSLGFPKAGKMLEVLIERGYVSPIVEGKQRKILMTKEQFAETFGEPV